MLGIDSILGKHNSEISVSELWAVRSSLPLSSAHCSLIPFDEQLHAQRNALTIAHNQHWLDTAKLTKDFATLRQAAEHTGETVDAALVEALAALPASARAALVAAVPKAP